MMRRYYREVVARGKEGVQPTFAVEGQSHVRIFLCIGAFMILHSRVPRVAFYVAKKTRVDRGNHDCFPTQSRLFLLFPAIQDAIQLYSAIFLARNHFEKRFSLHRRGSFAVKTMLC